MATPQKRKNMATTAEGAPYNKRSRPTYLYEPEEEQSFHKPEPYPDPVTGQRPVFPGLERTKQDGKTIAVNFSNGSRVWSWKPRGLKAWQYDPWTRGEYHLSTYALGYLQLEHGGANGPDTNIKDFEARSFRRLNLARWPSKDIIRS